MKPKTKFVKWALSIPDYARRNLIYNPYENNPMSLNICIYEVKGDTKLGEQILKDFGFKDQEVKNGGG